MSETKFTPGPWVWVDGTPGAIMAENGDQVVYLGSHDCPGEDGSGSAGEIGTADTALIVAAPDLYAALSALLGGQAYAGVAYSERIRMAQSALAKARGEE